MYFLQSEQENVHVYVFELEMWQSSNIVSGLLRSLGLLVGDVCVCVCTQGGTTMICYWSICVCTLGAFFGNIS